MPKKHIALLTAAALLSSSCSSTRKSIALGLATGAGTGAAIGAFTSPHGKGATTGLAVGALVGGIASYFIDKGMQDRDQNVRRDTLFNLEKHGVFGSDLPSSSKSSAPYGIAPAAVSEEYVETHVEDGSKLIEGHKIWTIQENSHWMREIPDRGGDR
jgi:hypothetical protein